MLPETDNSLAKQKPDWVNKQGRGGSTVSGGTSGNRTEPGQESAYAAATRSLDALITNPVMRTKTGMASTTETPMPMRPSFDTF